MEMFKCKWGETPKLTQANYHQWRPDMELFLGAEEALLIVIEVEEYPDDGSDSEASSWNKRIAKAAAIINSACHSSVKPYIRHITDARKMWKTLAEKLDTTASRAGRSSLLRQFHALRPTTSTKSPFGVTEYISQLTEYSNRLEGSEQAISDETFIAHLTTTLPETFKNIVDIILHQPAEEQTLTKVISTLVEWEQSEETRRSASQSTQPISDPVPVPSNSAFPSALHAETKRRSAFRPHYRSFYTQSTRGLSRNRGYRGRFRPRTTTSLLGGQLERGRYSSKECWHCGKAGHIQKNCFKKRDQHGMMGNGGFIRDNRNYQRPDGSSVLASQVHRTGQADLAVVHALTATTGNLKYVHAVHAHSPTLFSDSKTENNQWIIDSGASHHLTSDSTLFAALQPLQEDIGVVVGNGNTIKAIGSGRVFLEFHFGLEIWIEVLYVPGIERSLLSVSQLSNNSNLSLTFRNGYCYSGSYAIGMLKDGLYELMATPVRMQRTSLHYRPTLETSNPTTNLASAFPTTCPSLMIWHLRLGHLGLDALKKLLPAVSYANDENTETAITTCVTCIRSKQQRAYNRQPVEKTTNPFHLVHSDLCGPLTQSHSGYRYFILYIDDFSRTAWVYFLRSKKAEEVVSVFQEFQAMIDTQYPDYTIRKFRCDNGRGEYDNSFFRGILRVRGISFQPSPPYTQHKNGVSERMIRTISTKARSMLLDSRLEDIFWAEAVNTATYLHSRSLSSSLNGRTPFEVLNGKKPELQHLRRFGSAAHKLIPPEQRNTKFSSRSRQCLMLGYVHDTTKIWRLWDPVESRAIQASNVKFDEGLIEGKRVINEQVKDTLQDLSSSEITMNHSSDDDSSGPGSGAISNCLVTEVKPGGLKTESTHVLPLEGRQSPQVNGEVILEPASYDEAIVCDQHAGWKNAMKEEFASLKANETWAYVPASGEHAIGCRWVYRRKINADGTIRLKARVVIKGYKQIEGADYGETYAPVAKLVSFRLLLAIAARYDWAIHHMDVVTAFLNPVVDEDIYMEVPEGIEWLEPAWSAENRLVCKLKKSLYGLKQAP